MVLQEFPRFGIKINIPESWNVFKEEDELIKIGTPRKGSSDMIRENVEIMSRNSNQSLMDIAQDHINSNMGRKNFTLISHILKDLKPGSPIKVRQIVFTYEDEEVGTGKESTTIMTNGNIAYKMRYVAPGTTFDVYKSDADSIIQSTEFITRT